MALEDLGGNIRTARKGLGLSQEAVARRADVSLNLYGKLENGVVKNPHYTTIHGVANALGLSVDELVEGHPKAEAPNTAPSRSEAPAEFGSAAYAKIGHWRDLIIHIGGLLQDLDGIYEVTPDVFEQMTTLAFTVSRTYKLENPKAGATPEQVRYLEEAEGVLRSGLRMLEERAERVQAGVTDLGDYRAKKAEAMAMLGSTA